MRNKFLEWFNRYKFPELAASTSIVCTGLLSNYFDINKILESFLLTWCEFIADPLENINNININKVIFDK